MTPLDLSDYNPSDDLSRAETMPARWYIEPDFLALEAEKIFYKTWQPVGRVEDVMRIGDYFSCEVLDQPLVIVPATVRWRIARILQCLPAPGGCSGARARQSQESAMQISWLDL